MHKLFISAFIFVGLALSAHAWAANYDDPVDGIFRGNYGDSIAIEVPSLVSKSPDINEGKNGLLTFKVNSNTGYRNFNQLTDLKNGDSVSVAYGQDVKDKSLTATTITKTGSNTATVTTQQPVVTTTSTTPGVNENVVTTTTRTNSP